MLDMQIMTSQAIDELLGPIRNNFQLLCLRLNSVYNSNHFRSEENGLYSG